MYVHVYQCVHNLHIIHVHVHVLVGTYMYMYMYLEGL